VIADFQLFCQVSEIDSDEIFVAVNSLFAVKSERLTGFQLQLRNTNRSKEKCDTYSAILDTFQSLAEPTQTDYRPLQVYVDAALSLGDFGTFAHHFD